MNLTTFLTRSSLRLRDLKPRNRALQVLMLTLLSGVFSASCYAQQSITAIPVPQYNTLDALGVNVSSNTVAPTVNTLSIGGEMGLSHSITVQGNIFNIAYDEHGVRDKYAGGIRSTELGKKQLFFNASPSNNLWILNVTAMGDSAKFVELCNGTFTGDLPENSCTPTYYEAVHDKRHTLTLKYDKGPRVGEEGQHVVWTKPDGTEVYFTSGELRRSISGGFYKIIHPNGFTINVLSDITVQTNTGFQLKYNYVLDNRGVDGSKSGITYNNGYPVSLSWWKVNPKSITAINNAYEYCDVNKEGPCTNFTKTWPVVTFDWPGGMPRTFFMGKSVFRVTNPTGAVAEFNYEAQDAKAPPEAANTNMAPRLISIKPFGATKPTVSYSYRSRIHGQDVPGFGSFGYSTPGEPGILTGATGIVGSSDYAEYDLVGYHGKGYRGYKVVVDMDETYPSRLERVIVEDRTIVFDQFNLADQVLTDDAGLWSKKYTYINNNIQTVVDKATGTSEMGGYPASCVNPAPDRNRKTCNKPGWVKDSKGNTTYFTYHEFSGQVETVTSPPNKNGVSAVVRNKYEQKRASYYQAGVKALGDPIWLKTSEKSCMTTATVGDACVGNSSITSAQDEVVKIFEYNNDNLLLTGMTVTAMDSDGVVKPKRTCYQYDIYGNRIGETQPNAARTTCTP